MDGPYREKLPSNFGGKKMSSSVYCPRGKIILPMGDCLQCEFIRKDDDISNIWCRFLIGNQQFDEERETRAEQDKPDDEIRRLYAKIGYKRKRADLFYKTGKPRIAEKIENEIMKLRKEIKQHEIENQEFNQKKKTAL
jgi:hypothetical protein